GCGGDETCPELQGAISRCHLPRSRVEGPQKHYPKKISADAAPGDNSRAPVAASGIAARAAADGCEAVSRNCCKALVARPARGASSLARDTPESNTAPSSRADIASFCLAVSMGRRWKPTKNAAKHEKRRTPRETG